MATTRTRKVQMLTPEEERELALRWRDRKDQRALSRLVESHMGMVGRIAKEYSAGAVAYEDLLQEGNLGLIIAVQRFDPDLGTRLSTYAAHWIRASILNLILRSHGPVRIGTTRAQRKIFFGLSRTRRHLEQQGGAEANPAKIAEALGVEETELMSMSQRLSGADVSLDAPRGDGDARPWLSTLEDDGPSPEEQVMSREEEETRKARLQKGMTTLDPRERAILRARYFRERPDTLAALGNKFGISRERIRQLEERAKDKLNRLLVSAEQAG
jgi:RNA polymerase sigma-32 factor